MFLLRGGLAGGIGFKSKSSSKTGEQLNLPSSLGVFALGFGTGGLLCKMLLMKSLSVLLVARTDGFGGILGRLDMAGLAGVVGDDLLSISLALLKISDN